MYGIGLYPASDDRLIIADFSFLFFIFWTKRAFKQAIVTQFTLIKSTIYWYSQCSKFLIKAKPTLLTKIPISSWSSSFQTFSNFYLSWEFVQSNWMPLIFLCLNCSGLIACSFSITLLIFCKFLEIRHTLNPLATSSSQNPSPIPSVAPVTMAHVYPLTDEYL